MNRRPSCCVDVVFLSILATILALSPIAGAQSTEIRPVEKPTLVADKISYLPGETIIFSGSSWKPGEGVTIVIKNDSAGIVATVQGSPDENGILNVSATMPKLPTAGSADTNRKGTPIFTATAISSSGGSVSTQFTLGHAPTDAERLISEEEYWNHRLTYPTGHYSPAWTRKAAQQDRAIKRGVPAGRKGVVLNPALGIQPLSATNFTALGPMPEHMTGCSGCYDYGTTEGRVNAIVTDPTTTTSGSIVAYMGSVGGGVWKTTNCCTVNTTWTVMTDSPELATTSIDTLAIDPNNNLTIYAGTGDLNYGSFSMGSQGIYMSTDGGNTWTVLGADVFGPEYNEPAGNYPQYNAVGKVRVDPNNSNNIVAGTKMGLYLSHDQGQTWTNCPTNSFTSQRQDITGLELTNMGSGVTRILAAVGTRGFPTYVQYDLGNNGANGIYMANMQSSGCPTFTSIANNSNGFVFGTAVTGSPYTTGALMNAGSGNSCNYPLTGGNATYCGNGSTGGSTTNGGTVNNLGRIDIAVAPSNPNYIYAQVQSIDWNSDSGCGSTSGCQLGAWVSTNGGSSWTFMTGSAGGSLAACASSGPGSGSAGGGDYPQNWYDQGIIVDPNNPTRVFFDTFEVWLASSTGTAWYDLTCGYNGTSVANHVVHVDQHALAFVNGSSDDLLVGNDGGVHATLNASQAALNTTRPTWMNQDGGINAIEFYSGDISGNFATSSKPSAVGGAQDNGPSSAMFSGQPTGGVQWQMGLGGDGFSGLIDPMGTGSTQAQGTITLTGLATAGQQFQIGSQVFTFVTTRSGTGQVTIGTTTTTEANNIVTAVNTDIPSLVTAARSGSTVVVTAVTGGTSGNSIVFTNINVSNFSMNGNGYLGGTRMGDNVGSLRYWEGNNSGGFSRCIYNCTQPGATWSTWEGGWSGDTQSFVLPVSLFHGGIPGGDDCPAAGTTSGCGHLLAGTTRVWETISGTASSFSSSQWYVTNNPITGNLTKGTLGNRSYINQVKYSPKYQSVAIAGTNDGNVQIGFNLGTGTQAQANWVNVTGNNAVLPNRPIQGVALDPSSPAVGTPVGYAAIGGFNNNSPSTPGHVFRIVCTMASSPCDGYTWTDETGNLPDIPADSVIVNPNYPSQVFVGTDFGLYYTDNITANPPVWSRFNNGLPNTMVWDMSVDRGYTTLALWTRSRGAFVWPLPTGPESSPATMETPSPGSTLTGSSATFTWYPSAAAQAYWIDVGSTQGGNNYYQSGSLPTSTTSQTVNGLPTNGSTIYVTLWTEIGGQWQYNEYQYTASGSGNQLAVMQSPTPGSTLSGSSQLFTWTAGSGATAYEIDAGSTSGGNNYFQSGNLGTATSDTVTGLPTNGSTVYITLWSLVNGQWLYNEYTYTAAGGSGTIATMSSPTPGSTLSGSSQLFTWIAGSQSSAYEIDAGSTSGGNQYFQSGNLGTATSETVTGLPTDGSTVYITLWSLVGSQWVYNEYTYTAFNSSSGLAVMQSPTPGTEIDGTTATFTWSNPSNSDNYWLDIGSTSGGNDIYQSGNLGNATSTTVTDLPNNGQTIYATLWTLINGQWQYNEYTYQSGPSQSGPGRMNQNTVRSPTRR